MELAREIAAIIESMKGTELKLLEVGDQFCLSDYFLIASAANRRQAQAMAGEIDRQMKARGVPKPNIEGKESGWWVLMDFGEVVVHIFREEARSYYDLDLLWADAPRVELKDGEEEKD